MTTLIFLSLLAFENLLAQQYVPGSPCTFHAPFLRSFVLWWALLPFSVDFCSVNLSVFLHLSPNMANTVNAALKPLETLSRIVNQPSSLFGSKSASNKSKAEQDAQGASQDANSNQQDPGMEPEPVDRNTGRVGIVILRAWHTAVLAWYCFPGNLLAFQRSVIVAWESTPRRIA